MRLMEQSYSSASWMRPASTCCRTSSAGADYSGRDRYNVARAVAR